MDIKIQNIVSAILLVVAIFLYQSLSSANEKNKLLSVQLTDKKEELATANTTIDHLNTESIRINKLNESNSKKIQTLINISAKELESVKNAIKGIECTNVTLPVDAVNVLYNKASSIREQTDTK